MAKSTTWEMIERVAEPVSPVLEQMHREILLERIIHADETPVTVRLANQKGSRKGYVWVYLSGGKIWGEV